MRLGKHKKNVSKLAVLPWGGPRAASLFFLVVSFLLFFATSYTSVNLQGTRNAVTDLFAPILATVNYPIEKTATYVRAVTGIAHLQAENERLRSENMRLREWHQVALKLQEENATLHGLLNVQTDPAHRYITARIIADSGNAYVKSLLVMAGQSSGVKSKQAVVSSEGLIGRVIETGEKVSRILLLTDINSRIPVIIEKKNIHAILAGQNDDKPHLLHLPQDMKPENGTVVLTSGHGGMFPAGIPIGTIQTDKNGDYYVRPFTNPAGISYVKIIDKTPDPNLQQGKL